MLQLLVKKVIMENNSKIPCQFENEINLTKSEMSNIRQELKLTKDKFGKLEITNRRPQTNCQRCKGMMLLFKLALTKG